MAIIIHDTEFECPNCRYEIQAFNTPNEDQFLECPSCEEEVQVRYVPTSNEPSDEPAPEYEDEGDEVDLRICCSPGVEAINLERRHQLAKGYNQAHDHQHRGFELRRAAVALLREIPAGYPWGTSAFYKLYNNRDYLGRLSTAAAFLAAEIDRVKVELDNSIAEEKQAEAERDAQDILEEQKKARDEEHVDLDAMKKDLVEELDKSIWNEVCRLFRNLGVNQAIQAVVNSRYDTLDDSEIVENLQSFNRHVEKEGNASAFLVEEKQAEAERDAQDMLEEQKKARGEDE